MKRQPNDYTCVPTVIHDFLKWSASPYRMYSFERIKELCGTTKRGTSLRTAFDSLRKMGFKATKIKRSKKAFIDACNKAHNPYENYLLVSYFDGKDDHVAKVLYYYHKYDIIVLDDPYYAEVSIPFSMFWKNFKGAWRLG